MRLSAAVSKPSHNSQRAAVANAGSGYRYRFNGKEKDYGIANDNYDYGARMYDGRIGRWLTVDPPFS